MENVYSDILTVVIPTHNRKHLLKRCIQSIRSIYPAIRIIVGDNSSINYDQIDISEIDSSAELINTRKDEGNIYVAYKSIIEQVKTKYTLLVEDDDQLINKDLHYKILNILQQKTAVISFAGITNTNEKTLCYPFNGTFFDIPKFWDGKFQFGLCYYPTASLLRAFDIWFNYDSANIIDGTYDEAIALLTIQHVKSYYHFSDIGELIDTNANNMSWNNPKHRIFSYCKYIDNLTALLHMSDKWKNNYKQIQFNDIVNEYENLTYDKVFNNDKLFALRKEILNMINNHVKITDVNKYLTTSLNNIF